VINARYLRTATGAGIAIHVLLVVPLVLNTTRLSLVLAPQIRTASLVRWLSIANGVQIKELLANVKERGPQQIIRKPVSLLTSIPAMTIVKRWEIPVARVAEAGRDVRGAQQTKLAFNESAKCATALTCDLCSNHKSCSPCTESPYCNWCESDNTCKRTEDRALCLNNAIVHTCSNSCNYLGRGTTCAGCNAQRGCAWCQNPKGESCINLDTETCLAGAVIENCGVVVEGKKGFDGGSFVGGMFLIIGLFAISAIAYLVWRWKTGRKILYTELR